MLLINMKESYASVLTYKYSWASKIPDLSQALGGFNV